MKRASYLLSRFDAVFKIKHHQLSIDLSAFKTRVAFNSNLVFNQRTLLVVDQRDQSVIAFGDAALKFKDKLHDNIQVLSPLKEGKVANLRYLSVFLSLILKKILSQQSMLISRIEGAISLPSVISPVEESFLKNVLNNVRLNNLQLVKKCQAIYSYIQARYQIKNVCLIDIGYEITEIALFHQGELIAIQEIEFGAQQLLARIKQILREKYKLLIREEDLDKVFEIIQFDSAPNNQDQKKRQLIIRGKLVPDGIVKTMTVFNTDFQPSLLELVQELGEEIKYFFNQYPSSIVVEVLNSAVYLSGGISQISGLAQFLEAELQAEIIFSQPADLDVIHGLMKL